MIYRWLALLQRKLLMRSKRLSRKGLYDPICESVRAEAAVGGRSILNIGSGGEVGKAVSESWGNADGRLIAVDIEPEKEPEICTDACMLPFADESFSLVICCTVIEHVRDPVAVSNEILRVLRPGGRLILTAPFIYPIHDRPCDYFRFTKFGLRMLFEDFASVEINRQLNWGETYALLTYRILHECETWIRFLALPIYCCAAILEYTLGIIARLIDSDYIASGYTLIATK